MANALNKVNSAGIEDGSIVNADIKSDAAIAGSKLADNAVGLDQMAGIARGKLIVGDSSGDPAYLAAGSNDQILTMDANGDVGWEDPAASGATLSGSTDNTVVTVTGANAMQGEANLTFDGTRLSVGGLDPTDYYCDKFVFKASDEDGITIASNAGTLDANENNYIMFASTNSGAGRYDGYVRYGHQSHSFLVSVNNGGGSGKNFTFESDGDFSIGDGNLVVASGHGIDFSAHGNASGSTSELLDDYETGTWTIDGDTPNFNGFSSVDCHYSKVGRLVTISGTMVCNTNTSSTSFYVKYIPFAQDTKINIPVASAVSAADDGLFFFIDAGATTGYLRNASYGIQTYGTFSNKTLYFTCSYVSNA